MSSISAIRYDLCFHQCVIFGLDLNMASIFTFTTEVGCFHQYQRRRLVSSSVAGVDFFLSVIEKRSCLLSCYS